MGVAKPNGIVSSNSCGAGRPLSSTDTCRCCFPSSSSSSCDTLLGKALEEDEEEEEGEAVGGGGGGGPPEMGPSSFCVTAHRRLGSSSFSPTFPRRQE